MDQRITDPLSGTYAMFANLSEGVVAARFSGESFAKIDVQPDADIDAGKFPSELPITEVMITTRMVNMGDRIMEHATVYYFNDPDLWCYLTAPKVKDTLPEQTLTPVPEKTPETVSQPVPKQVPEPAAPARVSEQAPEKPPEKIPEKMSEVPPEQTVTRIPEQLPKPEQMPEQMSEPVKTIPELKVKGSF
jgi:hypothetical protein